MIKGLSLRADVKRCEDRIKKVNLDREKVRHALGNLLQNALHATPKGKEVRLLVQSESCKWWLKTKAQESPKSI